ncbi:MAG: hypothetical protein FWF49_06285 [Oscillospiraceae bacterium]|nr:hypothetical protein [Oscillospiraceae bacterium]
MKLKRLICLGVVGLVLIGVLSTAAAALPNSDYTLVDGQNQVPIPQAYTLKAVINTPLGDLAAAAGWVPFKSPQDLYINSQGYLFVADSGNNRILKLQQDGTLLQTYDRFLPAADKDMAAYADQFVTDAAGNLFVPASYINDQGTEIPLKDASGAYTDANVLAFLKAAAAPQWTNVNYAPATGQVFLDVLKNPQGVFADDNGNLYIADTGNYRIVHLAADGTYVEQFGQPTSTDVTMQDLFDPTKVFVSGTGILYALKGKNLISIDGNGNFLGYVGQSKLTFSLRDFIMRLIGNQAMKNQLQTRTPASYTAAVLGPDNLIYAATQDTVEGELKILNAVGINIGKKYGAAVPLWIREMFHLQFLDFPFSYGDRKMDMPSFSGITVDKDGIFSAVDTNTNRVFQYDRDGDLLCIFGNYDNGNNVNGFFNKPTAITVDADGDLYIADEVKNNIQVFAPTQFTKNIHAAIVYYNNGDYTNAEAMWQQVMGTGENYQLALQGTALAEYKLKDYTASMALYKQAGDHGNYSKAFVKYRYDVFKGAFIWVILAAAAIIAALITLIYFMHKAATKAIRAFEMEEPKRYGTKNMFMLSLGVFFHPVDTFRAVKESRGHLKLHVPIVLFALAVVVDFFVIFCTGFCLMQTDPRYASVLMEAAKILLPPLTFVVAVYAITSIIAGESKLMEIFTAASFCMVPYIVVNTILTLMSQFLSRNEGGVYIFIVNAAFVFEILLFLLLISVLNDYGGGKTLLVGIISGLATVLFWIVILLVLSLTAQFIEFIYGLYIEIKMKTL